MTNKIPRYLNACEQCAIWLWIFGLIYDLTILIIFFNKDYLVSTYLLGNVLLFLIQAIHIHLDIIEFFVTSSRYKRTIIMAIISLLWILFGCILIGLADKETINDSLYAAMIISIILSSFCVFSISGGCWKSCKTIENKEEVEKLIEISVKRALDNAMIEMANRLERGELEI